ncbi:MAG: hybrid sensor histidine kinase/response regulator [Pyrinomonadaceae bacterium]|nr:hybrid sensor histidine kinase/response regulator [Pyrinomonadaceae bacterium]
MYSEGNTRKIKVLLVEDDDDDFVLVKDLFAEIGNRRYELVRASSFEDAVAKSDPESYDVCLLDYQLGAHDGLELMGELRSLGITCPMILLTGQSDNSLDLMAMKAGASDYLFKGKVDAAGLERSIRYSIQQKQFENERINHIREQEARVQAEAANRAKDEFLAVLSHELRTPLNAMLGWARLLRTNRDNPDLFDRAVDAIERSAMVQTKFVEDLLDITRIVNGTLRLTKIPVDFASLTETAIDVMRPSADAKQIRLISSIDKSLRRVSGDPDRLTQVVSNLLSNSVKFTPEGGSVTVTLEADHNNVKLTVADTGVGIEPEFLPAVFNRYTQAHNSTTNRKGGRRRGRALVKKLVDMHEGTIAVHSDGEGKGAAFTVTIPMMPDFQFVGLD